MEIFELEDFCDDDFLFFTNTVEQPPLSMHLHNFTELVIVHKGSGTNTVENYEYKVGAGDVFVVTKGLSHEYKDIKSLRLTNILFDFDTLPLPVNFLRALPGFYSLFEVEPRLRRLHEFRTRLKIPEDQRGRIDILLEKIRSEFRNKKPGYKAVIAGVFTELIVFLSRTFSEQSVSGEALVISRMGEVLSKIETDFASNILLDDLIRTARMSQRSFIRHFSSVFNMSPIQYLLNVRIAKSKEMLLNTNKSISEIGMECGFPDSNYFSRIFKKKQGITPRAFRNQAREEKSLSPQHPA